MPSARPLARRVVARSCGLLAAVGLVGVAAAQSPETGLDVRIGVRFFGALVANLLLGGALVVFGPVYARESVAELRDDPAGFFLWGLLAGVGVPILLALLAVTIVGLLVAVPGLVAFAIVGLVGNAVTVVWVGSLLVGDEASGKAATVGAVALSIPASIPVLGNLVTTLVGFFGLGVVARSLYAAWQD